MPILGFEGTAHTLGVGVVDDGRVLANARDTYAPDEGGIHPREAARHHADVLPDVLDAALEEAGIGLGDVDAVAFSQGPGLGPCLRTVATPARALALRLDVPLVGVNHCVAHLEIGRHVAGMDDPVLLYVSGANTQVIAYATGRYRVIGETLDVGVGNMLDKFAREHGLPFPGGPEIEALAEAGGDRVELPYSVKGMDVAFSGILTAALQHDADLEDLAFSLQETVFAMLTEVTERALAHLGKDEVVLGGGVACNRRLRAMIGSMAEARGAEAAWPAPDLCVDNAAMIAHAGRVQLEAGQTTPVEASAVDQGYRTDQVDAVWRDADGRPAVPEIEGPRHCAEAVVEPATRDGRDVVVKRRIAKPYRHEGLDRRLRERRTAREARLLRRARTAGVRTPFVVAAEPPATLVLERIDGPTLREALADGAGDDLLRAAGGLLADLHDADLVHGDPTTSNLLVGDGGLVAIDFGLGGVAEADPERYAVDLRVLGEALDADGHGDRFEAVLAGYRDASADPKPVEATFREIAERGRYRGG